MILFIQRYLQQLLKEYEKDQFISGPEEFVTLKDDCDKLVLQLQEELTSAWKITPPDLMEVRG